MDGMEPRLRSSHCVIGGTPRPWGRKEGLHLKGTFQRRTSGEQVVSVVCLCGLGSRNQLAPFHNHPRLRKMSASWGRGWRDRQAVNLRDAGAWASRPRLPDSYFGVCCDWAQPCQARGLSVGALPWGSARSKGEGASPCPQTSHHEVLGPNKAQCAVLSS